MRYISLLNTPYSGSTLVSMLLCSQPRVIGFGDTYVIPDPRHYPKAPCTCGQWYDDCHPRRAITDKIRAGGLTEYAWDRATPVPVPGFLPWKIRQKWPLAKAASLPLLRQMPATIRRGLFSRFYRETSLMLQGLDDLGEYDVYFDGCKDLVRCELLRTEIEDLKLLHVIRHPGAYLYHFQKSGDERYDRHLTHWTRYNRNARAFEEIVSGNRYLAVTYESIVQHPDEFVDRIEDFFELEVTHDDDRTRLRRSQIHVMGNRMRESADRILDYSNSWRGKLPPAVEQRTDDLVYSDSWLRSLYAD